MEPDTLSRLKKVADRQTTVLTHYGRKTGNPREVTIWFALDGDNLYIGTANVNRQWVRNVQKTPNIKLTIGGETFRGPARSPAALSMNAPWLQFAENIGCFDQSSRLGGC